MAPNSQGPVGPKESLMSGNGRNAAVRWILTWGTSLLLLAGAAGAASAESTSEETADSLAEELAATLDAALVAAQNAQPQATAMQQRTRNAAVSQMKHVHSIAVEYRERVRLAKSIDDTEFFFGNLRSAVTSARQTAEDAVPDPEVARQLQRLDAIMGRLAALYAGAD